MGIQKQTDVMFSAATMATTVCGVAVVMVSMLLICHTSTAHTMRLPSSDVRKFLEENSLRGPMARHPDYESFPIKGVFAFEGLGPALFFDTTYFSRFVSSDKHRIFDMDMSHVHVQAGIVDPMPLSGHGIRRLFNAL